MFLVSCIVLSLVGLPAINGKILTQPDKDQLPYMPGVPHLRALPTPRIFMYDVPSRFHEGMIEEWNSGEEALLQGAGANCGTSWWNSLIGLQRCLKNDASPAPADADFFYVPFYPQLCFAPNVPQAFRNASRIQEACNLLNPVLTELAQAPEKSPNASFLTQLEAVGLGRLPEFWARKHGRDHVFPGHTSYWSPYLREQTLMNGPIRMFLDFSTIYTNYTAASSTDEYMSSLGKNQAKDFVVPYHFLRNPADVVAPPIDAPRERFMYLASSSTTFSTNSNQDRVALATIVKGEKDSLFHEIDAQRTPPNDTHAMMGGSQFCLAPPGDTELATRHTDSILAGCIPVVLTHVPTPLPFDNILDWSKFAVRLNSSSLYDGSLLKALREKPSSELRELRRQVYAVRPYFMISSKCESPSGVDLVKHQFALQKSKRQTSEGAFLQRQRLM